MTPYPPSPFTSYAQVHVPALCTKGALTSCQEPCSQLRSTLGFNPNNYLDWVAKNYPHSQMVKLRHWPGSALTLALTRISPNGDWSRKASVGRSSIYFNSCGESASSNILLGRGKQVFRYQDTSKKMKSLEVSGPSRV